VERFTLRPVSGAVLEAGLTAFVDAEGRLTGFILALRDVSRPARQEASRHGALAGTARALRGSLSSIRSLAESLLEPSPASAGEDRRLVAAIHAEAVRLSAVVEDLEGAGGPGLTRALSHAEQIPVTELLAVGVERLGSQADAVHVIEPPRGLPPLRVEVGAMSLALTGLLRLLLRWRAAGSPVLVRPGRSAGVVRIDLDTEGSAPLTELEAALDVPASGLGDWSIREAVQRHGGEVWAHPEAGRVAVRLSLPADGAGHTDPEPARATPLPGAGLVSGVSPPGARPSRPPLYDFTLLEQMERHLGPGARGAPLGDLTCAVIDTETTGLDAARGDRIVSVAAVRVRDGSVRRAEIFDALVNPGRPVPQESARLHGITDAMVAAAPSSAVVLPALWRFVEGAVLVGHEVWFDLDFLGREAGRLGLPPLPVGHPVLDTHLLSRAVHGETPDHSLEAVAGRLGVRVEGRHSALGDALATAEIFVRLLPLLGRRGIRTLGDAVDAGRSARTAL
jgi:DNA polymerase-3 subunit epsilon